MSMTDNLWSAVSTTLQDLGTVPGKMLSTQGIAQGAGFALISYVQGLVDPAIQRFAQSLPAPFGGIVYATAQGSYTNANIIYGLTAHK